MRTLYPAVRRRLRSRRTPRIINRTAVTARMNLTSVLTGSAGPIRMVYGTHARNSTPQSERLTIVRTRKASLR